MPALHASGGSLKTVAQIPTDDPTGSPPADPTEATQVMKPVIDLCSPSMPPEAAPCTVAHVSTADPGGSSLPAETMDAPIPKAPATNQPPAPALSSNAELPNATQAERNQIDRAYGLD